MSPIERYHEARRDLLDRVGIPAVALSVDGRAVVLSGPIALGLEVGGMVVIDRGSAGSWIAQVRDLDLVEREVAELELESDGPFLRTVTRPRVHFLEGRAAILGRLGDEGVSHVLPGAFDRSPVRPATPEETGRAIEAHGGGLELGTVRGLEDVPVALDPRGFTRHTFLCGQSGSGKTTTTSVLLEQLLAGTRLPLLVLDPNSDYVGLRTAADGAGEQAARRHLAAAEGLAIVRGRGAPPGSRLLAAHFSDLSTQGQAGVLDLDPIADLEEYAALRDAVEAAGSGDHEVGDIIRIASGSGPAGQRLATRMANLGVARWGLWCRPGEPGAATDDLRSGRGAVLDLGSLDTPREAAVAALGVLRAVWQRRRDRRPLLIVVDEAHNLFPAAPADALSRALCDLGVLIAGEGRKFGLHLLVVSQRPDKLHPNVLSQCENLALMRTTGAADLAAIRQTFSHVPAGMIDRAPDLGLGQVLVAGRIAPTPLFVQTRRRVSAEAGGDVPTDWATAPDGPGHPGG